jgi:histidyl-tRNA synthetase
MTSKKINFPRGTTDILPEEIPLWRAVEDKARDLFSRYGYKEIRTPLFEETELFSRSVGQTSDIVQKQMLALGAQGGQKEAEDLNSGALSLRPEGTAAVVRSYIQNNFDKKERLSKLFYIGPMFRGERPQKGRLRQFHQIGAEAIGPQSRSPYLDAETIALSVNILKTFGLENCKLKVNSLGTFADKEKFSALLREKLQAQTKDLCEDCRQRFERNVFRILDCKKGTCKSIVAKLDFGDSTLSPESKAYFQQVKEALNSLNISYEVSPTLVRGLDYYTDTVFEITDASLGSQDALGAGGRYNNLVSQLGGPDVDAIGFALGIERILLAMPPKENLNVTAPMDVFVIAMEKDLLNKAFLCLDALRRAGISADTDYSVASIKSQMRLANKVGARYCLILGQEEAQKGFVSLKEMATGEQKQVDVKGGDYCALINILIELCTSNRNKF